MINGDPTASRVSPVNPTLISVVVVTYNHEKYIAQCLDSILAQQGDFPVELVIADDCSTDQTGAIIDSYVDRVPAGRFRLKLLPRDRRYGMVHNYKRCFEACSGQYIAICEGDDYWTDEFKLQKQALFLQDHPNCSMCFNDIYLLFQETGEMMPAPIQQRLQADFLTVHDLVLENSIWNFSCCMYDARYMRQVPQGIFDLYIADWMFNICYAQFGDIGHVKELMSVYRKHGSSVWASKPPSEADTELYGYIDQYNKFLDYKFDAEFSTYQQTLEERGFLDIQSDLVVLDDVFPHPRAKERNEELLEYLREFSNVTIYTAVGSGEHGLEGPLDDLLPGFKRSHPEFAPNVKPLHLRPLRKAKVAYCASLANAHRFLPAVDQLGAPFVFFLSEEEAEDISDAGPQELEDMLRRIAASPCFTRVIVSDEKLSDDLARRHICWPGQIRVVTELAGTLDILRDEIAIFETNRGAIERRLQRPSQKLRAVLTHPGLLKAAVLRRVKAALPPEFRRWLRSTVPGYFQYLRTIPPLVRIWYRHAAFVGRMWIRSHLLRSAGHPRPVGLVRGALQGLTGSGSALVQFDPAFRQHDTAVILHLFYTDLWEEIANDLDNLAGDFDLYVSLTKEAGTFESAIRRRFPDAHVVCLENRGRDTAPFMVLLPAVLPLGYEYILKIHTKKSAYRKGGDVWRRGMLEGLLGSPELIRTAKALLANSPQTGMLCPAGYALRSSLYWSEVKAMTRSLAGIIGISMERYPDFEFVAGTMFWAKAAALQKLASLPLIPADFPLEPIHIAGNMPHAVERLIGLTVAASGYRISEIDGQGNEVPPTGVARRKYYGF